MDVDVDAICTWKRRPNYQQSQRQGSTRRSSLHKIMPNCFPPHFTFEHRSVSIAHQTEASLPTISNSAWDSLRLANGGRLAEEVCKLTRISRVASRSIQVGTSLSVWLGFSTVSSTKLSRIHRFFPDPKVGVRCEIELVKSIENIDGLGRWGSGSRLGNAP